MGVNANGIMDSYLGELMVNSKTGGMVMEAPQFYLIREKASATESIYRLVNAYIVECPKCGAKWDIRNGISLPSFELDDGAKQYLEEEWHTYKAEIRGKCEYDYMASGNGIIVSEKFLNALNEVSATGYTVKDIELLGWYNGNGKIRLDKNAGNYKELVVTGRCGYVRNKKHELTKCCDLCKTENSDEVLDGLGVDLDEWDGSDICFYTNLVWGHVIVTEKVKAILEKKKMKSIYFQKIEDYVWNGCYAN